MELSSGARSVVDNLRRKFGASLDGWTDEEIDLAHRQWSVSSDHPEEEKILLWLVKVKKK